MKFSSIIDSLLRRFASIDIIIEPEESAVREAVNKLNGADPKYFDGVKKIVVEHGSPKSPYLGKSTGESIVYISLDAIKNQLESQGLKGDQAAFINELVKTLGHEVKHIRGGMAPTESPSEVEEKILEQRFPTPALEKSAADLTEAQRRSILLHRELVELQTRLKDVQVTLKQLAGVHGAPERIAHFRSEESRLEAEVAAKNAEIDALKSSTSVKTTPTAPKAAVPASPEAARLSDKEIEDYKRNFNTLSNDLQAILASSAKLQHVLQNSPSFVRGEVTVIDKLSKHITTLKSLLDRSDGLTRKKSHLLQIKEIEDTFDGAAASLSELDKFLTSSEYFIRPLTNQGVEAEFYEAAISPIVAEIRTAIEVAAHHSFWGGHHRARQVPDVGQPKTRSEQVVEMLQSRPPERRHHGERTLDAIRRDFMEEYKELNGQTEQVRALLHKTVDQDKLNQLNSRRYELEQELVSSKDQLRRISEELQVLLNSTPTKEGVARQRELSAKSGSLRDRETELASSHDSVMREIKSLYDPRNVSQDEILKIIAPRPSVERLETRLSTVKEKLEKFKILDALKAELTTKREELSQKQSGPDKDAGETKKLEYSVSTTLPKKIADLEAELGASSSPRPYREESERIRLKEAIEDNMNLIQSPLVNSMFENVMKGVISGGAERGRKKDIEYFLPKDIDPALSQPLISGVDASVARRRSSEMLSFIGRLGQTVDVLLQQASGESSPGGMPDDILGPTLKLGDYNHDAGNDKIIRDISSAIGSHRKDLIGSMNNELKQLQDDALRNESADTWSESDDNMIKAKRKALLGKPEYQKLRTSIFKAIDSIVQQTESTLAPLVPAPAKTVRQRTEQVQLSNREERLGKELARRNVGTGVAVTPEEQGTERAWGESEGGKPTSDVSWKNQKWGEDEPLGREGLHRATRDAVELGLRDINSVPRGEVDKFKNRLHALTTEKRDLKRQLKNPSLSSKHPKILDRIKDLNAEGNKIRDILKGAGKYLLDVPALERELSNLFEILESMESRKHDLESEIQSLKSKLSTASKEEAVDMRVGLGKLRELLSGIESAMSKLNQHADRVGGDLKYAKNKVGRLSMPSTQQSSSIGKSERQLLEQRDPNLHELSNKLSDKRNTLKLREDMLAAWGDDASQEFRDDTEALKSEIANDERKLGISKGKKKPSEIRVVERTPEDNREAREHRERENVLREAGVDDKIKKYLAADKATRSAMARRRRFIDLKNPAKQLPSTNMLNRGRTMRLAYDKALALHPPGDQARETEMRTALYKHRQWDSYLRMLDDQYLSEATKRAESDSDDVREQYLRRTKYLDEMHERPEYINAMRGLAQSITDMDKASIIRRPEGVSLLKTVVQRRDMGRGVGIVDVEPDKMVGKPDPYMLFMRAYEEFKQSMERYTLAKSAMNAINRRLASARKRAESKGLGEGDIKKMVDEKYNQMLASNIAEQVDYIDTLVSEIDTLTDAQGRTPTPYYNPLNTSEYLNKLLNTQAELVRQKEQLRLYVQVREMGNLTAEIHNPDAFMKTMLEEFSGEEPTLSNLNRELGDGGPAYRDLAWVSEHFLWGKRARDEKVGRKVVAPGEPAGMQESVLTQALKDKFISLPRSGGKGGRGEKIPQFMQTKSRK